MFQTHQCARLSYHTAAATMSTTLDRHQPSQDQDLAVCLHTGQKDVIITGSPVGGKRSHIPAESSTFLTLDYTFHGKVDIP